MARITSQDLLLAGFHRIYCHNRTYWAHSDYTPALCFHTAASLLKARGVDEHGEMK